MIIYLYYNKIPLYHGKDGEYFEYWLLGFQVRDMDERGIDGSEGTDSFPLLSILGKMNNVFR